ncbi:Glyoxylase, beta-lactamase superfamily II [Caloranaerobacter azorensis DSM 13643]|uniref:Glyoxylase, beta-lactamase superfamily II n=1 Tax=Caloranaerobacter azorensis DSM 13643 TaxID=1121264 RepID=A0A1M5TQ72_9FIRM|nr:MBL fold metallo-hydrolase [Caloranaerobacter azorensis]SHH52917.1 Glyoxylase, beta-lactamase superfamily II [Caloranaerobacter azorensis DSM 13643]
MILERLPVGVYSANCYIIGCEKTGEAAVVDPGGDVDVILEKIEEFGLKVKYIILTHGHGDHIGGIIELKEKTNAKVLIHADDEYMLKDSDMNLSSKMSIKNIEINPDDVLKDGDIIEIGKYKAYIIHTPGHTKGSICIKLENNILTGDTLFAGSIGRTDLPGGSHDSIIKSIKERLLIYDDDVKIFPGHGPATTIGIEKITNPFIV